MQFSAIIATLSVALVASASPVAVEKRTTAQEVQNQCGANAQASCCNSVPKILGNILPITALNGCTALNLVNVLPLGSTGSGCDQNQQVTCCSGGEQTGLINIGALCIPVNVAN